MGMMGGMPQYQGTPPSYMTTTRTTTSPAPTTSQQQATTSGTGQGGTGTTGTSPLRSPLLSGAGDISTLAAPEKAVMDATKQQQGTTGSSGMSVGMGV